MSAAASAVALNEPEQLRREQREDDPGERREAEIDDEGELERFAHALALPRAEVLADDRDRWTRKARRWRQRPPA